MLAIPLILVASTLSAPDGGVSSHPALLTVATQVEAWNRGDLAAFCDSYETDAVFVSPNGVTKGRDEVLARYKKKYSDKERMGHLTIKPIDVRVNGDTVSIAAEWVLSYPAKKDDSGHTVIVLVRHGSQWRIVHDASM